MKNLVVVIYEKNGKTSKVKISRAMLGRVRKVLVNGGYRVVAVIS